MNKTNTNVSPMLSPWRLITLFVIVAATFVLTTNSASAEDSYFFRIDSELDVLIDTTGGATVTWSCNGSGEGIVTDNTASESVQALDGIIKVASTSAENNSTNAGCDAGEAITATLSFGGWLDKTYSGTVSSEGTNVTFTSGASLQYTIVVNGISDELGVVLTLDGTTASATYSGTVASQSYSGGKRYIAGSTSGGTISGGADGYVNGTSAALTVSNTASQSVDFDTNQSSDVDTAGLAFGQKITVTFTGGDPNSSVNGTKVIAGTVTAGDSLGTSCTIGTGANEGNWYCAVPLTDTETTASYANGSFETITATYADRSSGSDVQTTATIITRRSTGGGGSGPSTPFSTPTPTPSPAASPTPTPSVTPEVSPSPSVTPVPTVVKLYRKASDPKVYVQSDGGLLTWVRTLEDFNSAGYNWEDVQVITGPEFAKLEINPSDVVTVVLIRKVNDTKVYLLGDDGTLRWVRTAEEFEAAGYNWADVKEISGDDFAQFRKGGQLRIVQGISYLRVRDNNSVEGNIVGKVFPGEDFEFTDMINGWHKILKNGKEFGWVSGKYVDEI